MFTHQDSKWVDVVLDHMNITGDDRDREAQFVVCSISRVIEGHSSTLALPPVCMPTPCLPATSIRMSGSSTYRLDRAGRPLTARARSPCCVELKTERRMVIEAGSGRRIKAARPFIQHIAIECIRVFPDRPKVRVLRFFNNYPG
jgi:hypothetical protein